MFKNSKAFSSYSVDDIVAAKSFYQEILELDVEEDEMGFLSIHLTGGGEVILYPKPDHLPAAFTVLNFPVDDIDKAVDELILKGTNLREIFR